MNKTYLQCLGSDSAPRLLAADVCFREEPDEEEDDAEEQDGDEEGDDGDEGYSE